MFLFSALGSGCLLGWGMMGLPPMGHYRGPYGDLINRLTVPERHTTDAVTAVNYDFRGFDTLGEEYILFASVVGVTVLLRKQRGEIEGRHDDDGPETVPGPSEAVHALSVALIGPTVLFAIYIVTHGQLTPGGGFQGGVILATAPLLVYLAGEFDTFRRLASHTLMGMAEAAGAAGYALIGTAALAMGVPFLTNILPLGKLGSVISAGTIPLINVSVGLEVGAGFVLLALAFLEEVLGRKEF